MQQRLIKILVFLKAFTYFLLRRKWRKYQEPLTKKVIVEQSYHYSNWKIKQNIIFHVHLILFKTKRQRPINYIAFTFFKQARKKAKVNNEMKKTIPDCREQFQN